MFTPVLKISDIKKDPNIMLGLEHAFVCKRSNVVAHIVSSERMAELLKIEEDMKDLILCNERSNQKRISVNVEDL